jgi:DNA invertase Pin-like site-specific DNA recombinase
MNRTFPKGYGLSRVDGVRWRHGFDNDFLPALSRRREGRVAKVVRFGKNRSGTARCLCRACGKTFTPAPIDRSVTPEKEAEIERALAERLSQRGIARLLKVSRTTVSTVRKKGQSAS